MLPPPDGPSHYLREVGLRSVRPVVDGSTRFKHRLLTAPGWKVLHMPYFKWNALGSPEQHEEYLCALLGARSGEKERRPWPEPRSEGGKAILN